MNKVCIYHHLGLGDTIECNGMIRFYAEKYDTVDIFSKDNNYHNVCFMFKDNKKIKINKIDKNHESIEVFNFLKQYKGDILIPGHNNYVSNLDYFSKNNFGVAESFYYLANVPWKYRNTKFHIARDLEKEKEVFNILNPDKQKYIFVHDDESRGFKINNITSNYKIIKNQKNIDMFYLITLLEKAEEIHCMSSSILCLVDCLTNICEFNKLFLHYNIRKIKIGPNTLKGKWKIIK